MQIHNAILTGSTTVYGPINILSGSLTGTSSYAATSSYSTAFTVGGILTAQTLVVQTITSSIDYVTGSTRFGSLLSNTHTFTGSMYVTGSTVSFAGNLGLGLSTSPSHNLTIELSAASPTIRLYDGVNNNYIGGAYAAGNLSTGTTAGNLVLRSSTGIALSANNGGGVAMFVSSSGNVGIGTTNALVKLDVSGDVRSTTKYAWGTAINGTTGQIATDNTNNYFDYLGNLYFRGAAASNTLFTFTSAGNIGIGTTGSAWGGPFTFIQGGSFGQSVTFQSNAPDIKLGTNNYYNGAGYIYTTSSNGAAQLNVAGNSGFQFNVAPSGVAGTVVAFTSSMVITSAGNVGIGTTTTNYKLLIAPTASYGNGEDGNIAINVSPSGGTNTLPTTIGGILFGDATVANSYMGRIAVVQDNPASSTLTHMRFYTNAGGGNAAAAERVRITGAGNVGIGTIAPAYTLDVNGTSRSSGSVISSNNSSGLPSTSNTLWMTDSNSNTNWQLYIGGTGNSFPGGFSICQSTNARLVIVSGSGKVGMGTTTPDTKLHLYDGTNPLSLKIQRTSVPVFFSDVQVAGTTAGAAWSHNLENTSNGSFTWSGFTNTSYAGSAILLNADTGTSYITLYTAAGANTTPTERMRLNGSGELMINTTTARGSATKLTVNGTIRGGDNTNAIFSGAGAGTFEIDYPGVSAGRLNLDNSGNMTIRGTLTQNASDERLKNNIELISNALSKISKLRGVTFTWNTDIYDTDRTNDIGVIAQDVQSVQPDAVTLAPFDKDHKTGESLSGQNYLTVYYEKLIPLLIEGVKELSTKLDEANSRITALESK